MFGNHWQYDPANYEVGDDLWIRVPYGWNTHRADCYTVQKKTPSGQIVAISAGRELRISARGGVAGEDPYRGLRPCSSEDAAIFNAEAALDRAWRLVKDRADQLVHATRLQDLDKVGAARDAFDAAVRYLPA